MQGNESFQESIVPRNFCCLGFLFFVCTYRSWEWKVLTPRQGARRQFLSQQKQAS